jgi:hypothetical protein
MTRRTIGLLVTLALGLLVAPLAHHVSADAAASCLSRYTLRDATALRRLVEDAGFGAIEMRVLEVMRRMPASAASVVAGMARAPYARDVAAVGTWCIFRPTAMFS